jgi:hypothetical protein
VALALSLICAPLASSQSGQKAPGPSCSRGAICFSDRVTRGQEFRRALNADLEFVLKPGWEIVIVPKRPSGGCQDLASVVNPPYRAHRQIYIDTTYGWTAEEEVSASPREFDFVTNCADYDAESKRLNIVLWPYTATEKQHDAALAELGTSPLGKGRLWITGSSISHSDDTPGDKLGKIEWMAFSVEIKLPAPGDSKKAPRRQ